MNLVTSDLLDFAKKHDEENAGFTFCCSSLNQSECVQIMDFQKLMPKEQKTLFQTYRKYESDHLEIDTTNYIEWPSCKICDCRLRLTTPQGQASPLKWEILANIKIWASNSKSCQSHFEKNLQMCIMWKIQANEILCKIL